MATIEPQTAISYPFAGVAVWVGEWGVKERRNQGVIAPTVELERTALVALACLSPAVI